MLHTAAERPDASSPQPLERGNGDQFTRRAITSRVAALSMTAPPAEHHDTLVSEYLEIDLDGTERAFQNEYRDNEEPGLHVDVVSEEQLFASADKFDGSTGWPSLTTQGGDR